MAAWAPSPSSPGCAWVSDSLWGRTLGWAWVREEEAACRQAHWALVCASVCPATWRVWALPPRLAGSPPRAEHVCCPISSHSGRAPGGGVQSPDAWPAPAGRADTPKLHRPVRTQACARDARAALWASALLLGLQISSDSGLDSLFSPIFPSVSRAFMKEPISGLVGFEAPH